MTERWVPPGATWAAPPAPPPPPARAPAAGDDLPRVPVPLRPMTVADLLDGAFAIIKLRPRDVLALVAAVVVPAELLLAWLARDLDSFGDLVALDELEDFGGGAGFGGGTLALVVDSVVLALVSAALTVMVTAWYAGRRVPAGAALRTALRRSPALVVSLVAVHLLELVGLLALVVGAFFVMVLLQLTTPVLVAEGLGPFAAMARSVRLVRGRFGRSLLVPLLGFLVVSLVTPGFALLPDLLSVLVPERYDWLLVGLGRVLASMLEVPITAGLGVLLYLDLRVRSEGLDLELRRRALFPGA